MRRFSLHGIMFLIGVLCVLVAAPGCGDGKKKKPRGGGEETEAEETSGKGGPPGGGDRTELASTGWGTLKGKVAYDGTPPTPGDFKPRMKEHKDADHCLKGSPLELIDPTWVLQDGAVAEVVVWRRPPAGKYSKIPPPDKKTWKDEVVLDQPHCAFLSHVFTVFPSYYDGATKTEKPSGQRFKVINSAPISHNTRWAGSG